MIEISGIRKESLEDGKGIRTVIYLQGCNHECFNCQNPHTWEWGKGQLVSIQYLLNTVENDVLSKGVTFSGGCPMCNAKILIPLAEKLKEYNYNIWLYCGEQIETLRGEQLELLQYVDVLIDGRYIDELRDDTLAFRGSSNQRIIDVQESLKQNTVVELVN